MICRGWLEHLFTRNSSSAVRTYFFWWHMCLLCKLRWRIQSIFWVHVPCLTLEKSRFYKLSTSHVASHHEMHLDLDHHIMGGLVKIVAWVAWVQWGFLEELKVGRVGSSWDAIVKTWEKWFWVRHLFPHDANCPLRARQSVCFGGRVTIETNHSSM